MVEACVSPFYEQSLDCPGAVARLDVVTKHVTPTPETQRVAVTVHVGTEMGFIPGDRFESRLRK
jgi:hypothetical protein